MLGFEPNLYILKSETGSPCVRILFWRQLTAGIRTQLKIETGSPYVKIMFWQKLTAGIRTQCIYLDLHFILFFLLLKW